ncbi:MAG: prepilin-type N-terminal cleavage/methylation domain-containing protein [Gammaproteobacteria bacterium]|nr:prepilin-type N-terminal cleavage/methylation domain-containing protein [Planctomycetota bacterium]MCB1749185.1 prepilin-type N-terminal cleavage/methylation domain-containing protein [Gammaproteobacteria bacterium]MCP5199295.1 prepilin-type N-terminal cleavage/methylation domain-containing protein [Gammaproteobacteria bacterium]
MTRSGNRENGYSLIELISVMVIVGVLAVALLPRFADVDVFASRGYFEEALAATRYAHKLAMASGCSIEVRFDATADSLRVARWTAGGDCTVRSGAALPVARPGGGGEYVSTAPSGVDVASDLTFYFDRVGRPHDSAGNLVTNPAALTVDIGGRRLQVIPETGLVTES